MRYLRRIQGKPTKPGWRPVRRFDAVDGVDSSFSLKLGDYTFRNCTNLESVAIPGNITSIGRQAFIKIHRRQTR